MTPVFFTIGIPLLGAFCIAILPKHLRPALSVVILCITFLATLYCIPLLKIPERIFRHPLNNWFSLSFLCDGLGVFMAIVSSFVATLIAIYSIDYIREYPRQEDFYFWMVLFVGSMMGLIFSANLLLLYIFWEVTAVCSWRLISFYRKESDIKAADRAFLITFFGASIFLAGIILIFLNYQTLDIVFLKDKALTDLGAFLLFVGIIAKSAQLPLHTWLPDAGVAPTPVTALLHAAVLVKIGIYTFARLFVTTFNVSVGFLEMVMVLSILTIIVGAGSALVENNIKRILAYSTISQLGYIIFALVVFGKEALFISLVYVMAHSLAKAGLFLCAGIIEHKTHTKDINELGGLLKDIPTVAIYYILCAFSIIGLPPSLGFWPKFFLILSSAKQNNILASVVLVLGAFLTLLYLFRVFDKVFLGQTKIQISKENIPMMVSAVSVFATLSFILGLGAISWLRLVERIFLL